MTHNPDIAFAIAEILAGGELVVVPELTPDHGAVKESKANIIVQDHISGSATIQTGGSVIVEGSITGSFITACRIEAGGEVIVAGSALNAHITARSILIGGETRSCRLHALGGVTLLHNLDDSEITLGDLGPSQPLIAKTTAKLTRLSDQRDILTRQVRREGAHLHASCNTPRSRINLGVGQIIRHRQDQIHIDLGQFYQHLQKDGAQDVDAVLGEFFNKGVIGVLSRVNRAYFAANPAHERVFTKLLQQLRELVNLVRQRDLLDERIADERQRLERVIERLTNRRRLLKVEGRVRPEVLVRYNRPQISLSETGDVQVEHRPVDLVIDHGPDPEQYRVQRGAQTQAVPAADLRAVACKLVADERIEILPLEAPAKPAQPPPYRDRHLLVIEDSRKTRESIIDALTRGGFARLAAAANGDEGLALFARSRADLVLLEWDLIGARGLDCMRALIQAARPDDLAVIALTSRGSEESVATALREGAAGYLLKPFNAEELVDKVEEVLAARAEGAADLARISL